MLIRSRPFDETASESGKGARKWVLDITMEIDNRPASGRRKQSATPAPSEVETASAVDSDDSESEEEIAQPKRSKKMQAVAEESDEEEEEDEDVESILGSESD